jgi:hypothetical protein
MTDRNCTTCGKHSRYALKRRMCGTCYSGVRNRRIAYGRWESNRAAADPVRAHIDVLKAAGMDSQQIRRIAGVPTSTFNYQLSGSPSAISRTTAQKILAVPVPASTTALVASARGREIVPAVGARRRLRALVAAGWTMRSLADELDIKLTVVCRLIHDSVRIRAYRHHEVDALFARLQLTAGPSDTARAYARARRWPLPFQWDEESIDEPDGRPAPGSRRYQRTAS